MTDHAGYPGKEWDAMPRPRLTADAENSAYIFTELHVGYRMPKGETQEQSTE